MSASGHPRPRRAKPHDYLCPLRPESDFRFKASTRLEARPVKARARRSLADNVQPTNDPPLLRLLPGIVLGVDIVDAPRTGAVELDSLKALDPDGRLEKRTNSGRLGMSAFCPKGDIRIAADFLIRSPRRSRPTAQSERVKQRSTDQWTAGRRARGQPRKARLRRIGLAGEVKDDPCGSQFGSDARELHHRLYEVRLRNGPSVFRPRTP